jgi:hypothetical protein
MQALAVAHTFLKETNKPILIVTISDDVAAQAFMGDADKLGINSLCAMLPGLQDPERTA